MNAVTATDFAGFVKQHIERIRVPAQILFAFKHPIDLLRGDENHTGIALCEFIEG